MRFHILLLLSCLLVASAQQITYFNVLTGGRFPGGLPAPAGRGVEFLEDIDGNGRFDFFTSGLDVSNPQRGFWLQNEAGVFQSIYDTAHFPQGVPMVQYYGSVSLADLNGDGRKDFVLIGDNGGGVGLTYIYFQQPNGSFINVNNGQTFLTGALPGFRNGFILADDVSGDGHPDLIIAAYSSTRFFGVWLNNGNGTFSAVPAAQIFPAGSPASLWNSCFVYKDLDGDGLKDFVVSGEATGNNYFGAFRQSPAGTFRPFPAEKFAAITNPRLRYCAMDIGDINGDGFNDLVQIGQTYGTSDGHTNVFVSNGTNGTFVDGKNAAHFTVVPQESRVGPLFVRDLNGDGRDDIFWAGQNTGGTRILYIFFQNAMGVQESSLNGALFTGGGDFQATTASMGAITPPDQPPTISLAGYVSSYTRFMMTMKCPSNTTSFGPSCLSCGAGEFMDSSKYRCSPCPNNSISTNGSMTACQPCASGQFTNYNRTACIDAVISPASGSPQSFLSAVMSLLL